MEQCPEGNSIWNGHNVAPIGKSRVRNGDGKYDVSSAIQNAISNKYYILNKLSVIERLTSIENLESVEYKQYKTKSGEKIKTVEFFRPRIPKSCKQNSTVTSYQN